MTNICFMSESKLYGEMLFKYTRKDNYYNSMLYKHVMNAFVFYEIR